MAAVAQYKCVRCGRAWTDEPPVVQGAIRLDAVLTMCRDCEVARESDERNYWPPKPAA